MRFSVQIPVDRVEVGPEFYSAAAIAEMAKAAEAAGFDAGYVTEHPIPPDAWLETGGHHALDPFVALAAVAMATERLCLHTNILVLAYRNPFLTAKALASLDVLSNGRVIAGVAAGYLTGEYRALGADFDNRNEATDDALRMLKRAWSGESINERGFDYSATGNTALPQPVQKPHPPIWVGGNSRAAIRRAATHAQGWSPFPLQERFGGRMRTAAIESVEDVGRGIVYLKEVAEAAGRDEAFDVNFVPFGYGMNAVEIYEPAPLVDQIGALAEVGVTWVTVSLPFTDRASYVDVVQRFGAEVIAASR